MQEHPIPRQITTFEFKLIGELTIKQFGFLASGIGLGALLFFLVPKFIYLNFIVASVPTLLGIGFAFVPINERPMDIWLKNLFKRLFSPTQYFYRKNNRPPKILLGLQLPPREVLLQHIKAQQSLNEYMQKKPKTSNSDNVEQIDVNFKKRQENLQSLFSTSKSNFAKEAVLTTQSYTPISPSTVSKQPVLAAETDESLSGVVMSSSGVPLPNRLVYLKKEGETVRLFKTNSQGQFKNSLPLAKGEYLLEILDPQKKHTFARMKVNSQSKNLEILAQK